MSAARKERRRQANRGIDATTARQPWWRSPKDVAICVALCLGSFLLYARTFSYGFLNYDDDKYVTANAVVQQGLSPSTIGWAFTTTHFANWLPVTWLSHLLDVSLFGLNGGGHHATSALLHGVNATLLFLALQALTGSRWRSAAAAVLFAVHPLRVESVAWIAERKDVLAGTFFLAALLAYAGYARRPSAWRYALVCALHALGLMAKTMLVTFPVVLLLLDVWPLRRVTSLSDRKLIGRLLLEKAPLFVLSGIASAWTVLLQEEGGALYGGQHLTPAQRAANAAVSVARYLGKMLWPTDLAVMYPHPGSWPAWAVLASIGLIVLITLLAAWLARRGKPYVLLGWAWFLVMLLPVSGVLQAGLQAMADRYTYLPGIGLTVAVVWAVGELLAKRPWGAKAGAAVLGVITIVLAVGTVRQQRVWADTITLMNHAVAVTNGNFVAHELLGRELAAEGDVDAAERHFAEASRINSGYVEAWYNWANLLVRTGRPADAIERYRQALVTHPANPEVRLGLGTALAMTGDFPGAEREYREALRLKPGWSVALTNLAAAVRNQRRTDEAYRLYEEALRIDPNDARARRGMQELRPH